MFRQPLFLKSLVMSYAGLTVHLRYHLMMNCVLGFKGYAKREGVKRGVKKGVSRFSTVVANSSQSSSSFSLWNLLSPK